MPAINFLVYLQYNFSLIVIFICLFIHSFLYHHLSFSSPDSPSYHLPSSSGPSIPPLLFFRKGYVSHGYQPTLGYHVAISLGINTTIKTGLGKLIRVNSPKHKQYQRQVLLSLLGVREKNELHNCNMWIVPGRLPGCQYSLWKNPWTRLVDFDGFLLDLLMPLALIVPPFYLQIPKFCLIFGCGSLHLFLLVASWRFFHQNWARQ